MHTTPNWADIKARWCVGESAITIAKDYLGITPGNIRQRAYKFNWKRIKDELQASVQKQVEERLKGVADKVLNELESIAFANLSDVIEWDDAGVTVKCSDKLDEDVLPAIQEVSIVDTEFGRQKKVKMIDKMKALDTLAKIAGLAASDRMTDTDQVFELVIKPQADTSDGGA